MSACRARAARIKAAIPDSFPMWSTSAFPSIRVFTTVSWPRNAANPKAVTSRFETAFGITPRLEEDFDDLVTAGL